MKYGQAVLASAGIAKTHMYICMKDTPEGQTQLPSLRLFECRRKEFTIPARSHALCIRQLLCQNMQGKINNSQIPHGADLEAYEHERARPQTWRAAAGRARWTRPNDTDVCRFSE